MKKQSLVFFGTSDFAVPSLLKLISNNYKVEAVITKPGNNPIKNIALKNNIVLLQPDKLSVENIDSFKSEVAVLAAYGLFLKPEILNFFKFGIINLHPSLLPLYRGPSPIQYALLNNEKDIGVSLMKIDSGLDTGPIIAQEKIILNNDDDYTSLISKLGEIGANILIKNIDDYLNNKIILKNQNNNLASYSKIISRDDGLVTLEEISNMPLIVMNKLKAFSPWPGIFFIHNNKRFKIIKAHLENTKFIIDLIQPEGKKNQSFKDFKNGYPDIKI